MRRDRRAPVLEPGSPVASRPWQTRDFVLLVVLLAGTAAVMAGGFHVPGSEFDEGRAVAFPDRLLHGAVPYRDFESFYGPADTYLTAAAFKIFGSSMYVERAVGFVTALVIVLALYVIGRRFGRLAAFGSGLVGSMLLAGDIAVTSQHEAQAFALLGLAASMTAAAGKARFWYFVGGLLGAVALLFRLEYLPAVLLSAVPLLLWGSWWRNTVRYILGFSMGLLPYAAIAALVGGQKLHRNFRDLRETGRDRRLPFPSLTSDDGRLLVLAFVATVALVVIGSWHIWKRRQAFSGSVILSGGILGALSLPIALWRVDDSHVVISCLVPFSFLPMAAALIGRRPTAGPDRSALAIGGVTAVLVLFLLGSHAVRGGIHANIRVVQGQTLGYSVANDGRSFLIESKSAARDLQKIVDTTQALAKPGQALFVGPQDLRRTNSNDVFVYYLLPQLNPASFNIELDPPASKPGSPLPRELARADYLILTSRWDSSTEPNASSRHGSPAADNVVRRRFCTIERAGTYALYRRCR